MEYGINFFKTNATIKNAKAVAKLRGKTIKLVSPPNQKHYKIRGNLKPNRVNKIGILKRPEAA